MKFKTFFAAMAVALTAPSFAAIAPGSTGNGELFLVVQDSVAKVSYTLDLGLRMNDFYVDGQSDLGKSLSFDVAGDSSWADFLGRSSAASRQWGVLAFGGGANATARVLSTVRAGVTENTMDNTTNTRLATGGGDTLAGTFFSSVNSSGTHAPAADFSVNGSSVIAEADFGKGYFGEAGGTSGTLNGNLTFSVLNAIGVSSSFYQLAGSSAAPGGFIKLDKFNNAQKQASFAFDGSTLAYTLAPVPEPESYALMLAGLAALGLMIKRSRA